MIQIPLFLTKPNRRWHQLFQFVILLVSKEQLPCPICGELINVQSLEVHAATCGEEIPDKKLVPDPSLISKRSLREELQSIHDGIKQSEDVFSVSVIRRLFKDTAFEQLDDSNEEDWKKPIKITFIGEEGVDAGGLTREFFTLFFQMEMFDGFGFCIDSRYLHDKRYHLLVKVTALVLINGHPGPRIQSPILARYILCGREPRTEEIDSKYLGGDVILVIEEINDCSDNLTELFEKHSALLSEAGFRQFLTIENRQAAINALKIHNGFYKYMAPMLQFMEGLNLHGILQLLKLKMEEGMTVLCHSHKFTSAEDVIEIFKPHFSENKEEKDTEEIIVYHWRNFLKKVERENVSTEHIDFMKEKKVHLPKVTLNISNVLQTLVGCPSIPINIGKGDGSLEFDHNSNRLSTANTCAPSICFSSCKSLQDYKKLEEHMISIIMETDGFGIV